MTREEILIEIYKFAKEHNYGVTEYAEKIAEAKRRMGKGWQDCPCKSKEKRFCGSEFCKEEIKNNGICHCNLFFSIYK